MNPEDWQAIGSTIAALTALGALYFAFLSPRRRALRRFNEQLLGYPAGNGMIHQPSIFEAVDGITKHLIEQDATLAHILHEIPPNGVPFRSDVEGLKVSLSVLETNISDMRADLRGYIKDRRRVERRWIKALAAHDISVPESEDVA